METTAPRKPRTRDARVDLAVPRDWLTHLDATARQFHLSRTQVIILAVADLTGAPLPPDLQDRRHTATRGLLAPRDDDPRRSLPWHV